MNQMEAYSTLEKIVTIDCEYLLQEMTASFLLINNGRGIFIENNTIFAIDLLRKALAENRLRPEDVDYLIVSHLHLDHAGGTAALLEHCPQAKVLAHPKGKRYLVNPQRLIAGAKAVYGERKFQRLYGHIAPVAESRIETMQDGEIIDWQGLKIQFMHTNGHSSHHLSIFLPQEKIIFTGDAFGSAYRFMHSLNHIFCFPATVPPEFDVQEAEKGASRLATCGADFAYLTHYGRYNLPMVYASLKDSFDFVRSLLAESRTIKNEKRMPHLRQKIDQYYANYIHGHGLKLSRKQRWLLAMESWMNAMGMDIYLRKQIKKTD